MEHYPVQSQFDIEAQSPFNSVLSAYNQQGQGLTNYTSTDVSTDVKQRLGDRAKQITEDVYRSVTDAIDLHDINKIVRARSEQVSKNERDRTARDVASYVERLQGDLSKISDDVIGQWIKTTDKELLDLQREQSFSYNTSQRLAEKAQKFRSNILSKFSGKLGMSALSSRYQKESDQISYLESYREQRMADLDMLSNTLHTRLGSPELYIQENDELMDGLSLSGVDDTEDSTSRRGKRSYNKSSNYNSSSSTSNTGGLSQVIAHQIRTNIILTNILDKLTVPEYVEEMEQSSSNGRLLTNNIATSSSRSEGSLGGSYLIGDDSDGGLVGNAIDGIGMTAGAYAATKAKAVAAKAFTGSKALIGKALAGGGLKTALAIGLKASAIAGTAYVAYKAGSWVADNAIVPMIENYHKEQADAINSLDKEGQTNLAKTMVGQSLKDKIKQATGSDEVNIATAAKTLTKMDLTDAELQQLRFTQAHEAKALMIRKLANEELAGEASIIEWAKSEGLFNNSVSVEQFKDKLLDEYSIGAVWDDTAEIDAVNSAYSVYKSGVDAFNSGSKQAIAIREARMSEAGNTLTLNERDVKQGPVTVNLDSQGLTAEQLGNSHQIIDAIKEGNAINKQLLAKPSAINVYKRGNRPNAAESTTK